MRQKKALAFSGLGLVAFLLILFSLVVRILPSYFLFIAAALCIGVVVLGIQILRDNGSLKKGSTGSLTVLPIVLLGILMGSGAIYYVINH